MGDEATGAKADETKVIRDMIDRGLITRELGDQALSRANPDASAIDLLVREGYLTRHVVDTLLADAHEPTTIGDFKILGRLGQGGMATVYKAVQQRMHREVALKVIDPQFAINKDFCERFIREARVAGQINHPNVITCHDVGQDKGYLYMALELVTGGDAAQVAHQEGGRLPEARALRVLIDAARGLGAFARAGLIHRDIKPANIFITEDGVAKLADLGLARPSADSERMTSAGMPVGTPAYMSPEQAAGEESIDHRTDIYSLGATLFALVTGQSPFSGPNALAVLAQVQKDPVPDPRRINPQVSDATAAIIAKAMAKLRDDRYAGPDDLLEDLRLAAAGRPLRHAALIPTARWPGRRDATARQANPAAAPIAAPPVAAAPAPAALDAMTLAADLRAETTPSPRRTVDWTRRMSSNIGDGRLDDRRSQLLPWLVISLSAGALAAALIFTLVPWNTRTTGKPAPIVSLETPHAPTPPAALPLGRIPDREPMPVGIPGADGVTATPDLLEPARTARHVVAPIAPTVPLRAEPREPTPAGEADTSPSPVAAPVIAADAAVTAAPVPPTTPAAPAVAAPVAASDAPAPAAVAAPAITPDAIAARETTPTPAPAAATAAPAIEPEAKTPAALPAPDVPVVATTAPPAAVDAPAASEPTATPAHAEPTPDAISHATVDAAEPIDLAVKPQAAVPAARTDAADVPTPVAAQALVEVPAPDPAPAAVDQPTAAVSAPTARADVAARPASAHEAQAATWQLYLDKQRFPCTVRPTATGLEVVHVDRAVRDLTPLMPVPMERLDLEGCDKLDGDLSALGSKPSTTLRSLNLKGCRRLRRLDGIENAKLEELSLNGCAALNGDLTALSGMHLARLDLAGCANLDSLNGIQRMPLTELDLGDCSDLKGDLSALRGMRLTRLNLIGCSRLANLRGVEGMPLTALDLRGCRNLDGDLQALTNLPLTRLGLIGCEEVDSLRGLEGMRLTELNLSGCRDLRGDLSALRGMPLKRLWLSDCRRLTSLDGLQRMPLTELDLTNCESLEGDLSALRGMPITRLSLAGCKNLTSLNGVQGMALQELDLAWCVNLRPDLAPLAGVPLTKLNLTRCSNLVSLHGIERAPLKKLILTRTSRLEDQTALATIKNVDVEH